MRWSRFGLEMGTGGNVLVCAGVFLGFAARVLGWFGQGWPQIGLATYCSAHGLRCSLAVLATGLSGQILGGPGADMASGWSVHGLPGQGLAGHRLSWPRAGLDTSWPDHGLACPRPWLTTFSACHGLC
jgi:hypothetical protein